jgi:hypothetical protein
MTKDDAGIKDAIEAFWEAQKKDDSDAGVEAFRDMWRLVDDDSGEEDAEGEADKEEPGKKLGRPLAALIIAKKGKD